MQVFAPPGAQQVGVPSGSPFLFQSLAHHNRSSSPGYAHARVLCRREEAVMVLSVAVVRSAHCCRWCSL
jgi:hypothetical protein